MCQEVHWDPTGRYVATVVNAGGCWAGVGQRGGVVGAGQRPVNAGGRVLGSQCLVNAGGWLLAARSGRVARRVVVAPARGCRCACACVPSRRGARGTSEEAAGAGAGEQAGPLAASHVTLAVPPPSNRPPARPPAAPNEPPACGRCTPHPPHTHTQAPPPPPPPPTPPHTHTPPTPHPPAPAHRVPAPPFPPANLSQLPPWRTASWCGASRGNCCTSEPAACAPPRI